MVGYLIDIYKNLLSLSFLFFFSLGRKTINQSIGTKSNKTRDIYLYIHHEALHPRCVALCCWNSTGFLGTSFLLYPPLTTTTSSTNHLPLLPCSSASTPPDPNSEYAEVSKAMPENPTWDVDLRRYVIHQ